MVPTNSAAYEVISKGIGTTALANLYTYTHIHTHRCIYTGSNGIVQLRRKNVPAGNYLFR